MSSRLPARKNCGPTRKRKITQTRNNPSIGPERLSHLFAVSSLALNSVVVSTRVMASMRANCATGLEHQLMFIQMRYRLRWAKLSAMHHSYAIANTDKLRKIAANDQDRLSGGDEPV